MEKAKYAEIPGGLPSGLRLWNASAMEHGFTEIDREDFRNLLVEMACTYMPYGLFGKDRVPPDGTAIMDLPEEYLLWFKQRGFPKGRLGELMAHACEIKELGMNSVFDPLRVAKTATKGKRKPGCP